MTRLLLLALLLFSQLGVVVVQRGGVAVTPVTQVITGGLIDNLVAADTDYFLWPMGIAATGTTIPTAEAQGEQILLAGTLSNLYVAASVDIGNEASTAETLTVTVRKCPANAAEPCVTTGATPGPLTCTITDTAAADTQCSDLVNSMHVNAGDRVVMLVRASGPNYVATSPRWSMKWTGDNSNESMLSYIQTHTGTATRCLSGMPGRVLGTSTCTTAGLMTDPPVTLAMVPDASFSIAGIYARATDPITAGCMRITSARTSGGASGTTLTDDTTFQVDLTDSTTQSDLTGTPISLAQYDGIGNSLDPGTSCGGTGSATGGNGVAITLKLQHSSQYFLLSNCTLLGSAVTRYSRIVGAGAASSTTETMLAVLMPMPAWIPKGIVARQAAAPTGSGNYWEYALRDDSATITVNEATQCRIENTATTCSSTPNQSIAAGSLVNWLWTPGGTPATAISCRTVSGL